MLSTWAKVAIGLGVTAGAVGVTAGIWWLRKRGALPPGVLSPGIHNVGVGRKAILDVSGAWSLAGSQVFFTDEDGIEAPGAAAEDIVIVEKFNGHGGALDVVVMKPGTGRVRVDMGPARGDWEWTLVASETRVGTQVPEPLPVATSEGT